MFELELSFTCQKSMDVPRFESKSTIFLRIFEQYKINLFDKLEKENLPQRT